MRTQDTVFDSTEDKKKVHQPHELSTHLSNVYNQLVTKQEDKKKKETQKNKEEEKQKERDRKKQRYEEDQTPEELGHQDAIIETIKEQDKQIEKLEKLVKGTESPLFVIKSFFPFDLFPDRLTIRLSEVNIEVKEFFLSSQFYTIAIVDIKDVAVERGPILSGLKVESGSQEGVIKIRHVKYKEALKAKKIIQGLITAKREGIELALAHDMPDFIEKIEKIGSVY